jgi:hypothetical protein
MKLPKNNRKLDQIFKNGSEPSIEEFVDQYWVDMLTGMIPNFRWAGHRKRFFRKNENKVGNNIILFNTTFGHFQVVQGRCEDFSDLKVIILDYGDKRNFLTRSVRDKIRKIDDDLFLGRYYNVIKGTYFFKGYFALQKK